MAKQKTDGNGGEVKFTKAGVPRKAKGAELTWNADRDAALVGAIAGGIHNTSDLAEQLASYPMFADVKDAVTAPKIRLRIYNLRTKQGVAIPEFGRSRGYVVDSAGLNALLGVATGGGEQPAQ
jgi:hypothetical protein